MQIDDPLTAIAVGLGTGYAGALIPVINVEAVLVAASVVSSTAVTLLAVLGVTLGQTLGKLTIFELSRRARLPEFLRRKGDTTKAKGRWATKSQEYWQVVAGRLAHRPTAALTVLLSAAVGIPPLAIVSVMAGRAPAVRRLDFALAVLVGRAARFVVVAAPGLVFLNR